MKIWSAGAWPCRDGVELDLVAAGWVVLKQTQTAHGCHETLSLTELGVRCVAEARRRNQRALSAHDALAGRMARELLLGGRLVWRELSLRAQAQAESFDDVGPQAKAAEGVAEYLLEPQRPLQTQIETQAQTQAQTQTAKAKPLWRVARPDVFSVRNTSVEEYLQPVVHEIKVSRADLQSDLRHAAKRESYRWLCSECYYVFPAGVAEAAEIPEAFGVWVLHGGVEDGRLELLRPARHRPCRLPFSVWLALAKATPVRLDEEPAQGHLGSQLDGGGEVP
ncbi:hypothetical protein LNV09_22875 [Paucibacter sp. B2R-40]|uniref:hypothetical protein n=1 Tax=Paucibacter sp. B2R-40 TaxID=2893554 RepID=UPI0021E424E9|nr:hypothetical protein [Paucibacter sp. B2R-40]MCV2356997.1 hypothetical protein [Paucibacter sp. B2R-40]